MDVRLEVAFGKKVRNLIMGEFNTGNVVKMVKTEKWLEPMKVGNEYVIQDIKYGVATLYSDNDEKYYSVADNILEKYFTKVEIVEEDVEEAVDYIDMLLADSQFNFTKVFDKCMIVACKLPNGFVIVESSSCIDPEDYDEDIGIDICLSRIKMRIAEMEAYVSHEEMIDCDCECCCGCDCSCEDDVEEDCTQNDLDCNDCPNKDHCEYVPIFS